MAYINRVQVYRWHLVENIVCNALFTRWTVRRTVLPYISTIQCTERRNGLYPYAPASLKRNGLRTQIGLTTCTCEQMQDHTIISVERVMWILQSIKDKSTDRPQQGTAADLPQKPTTVRQPLRPSDYEEVGYNYEGLTEEQYETFSCQHNYKG